MKARVFPYWIVVLLCVSATFAFANDFKSVIIAPGRCQVIKIPNDHFLLIRNFTQDGGGSERGVVTAEIDGVKVNVLAATIIDSGATATTTAATPTPTPTPTPAATPTPTPTPPPLEVINNIVIAGPAMVTATCPFDATGCVITYRRNSDD